MSEHPSPFAPTLASAIQIRPGDDLAGAVAHAPADAVIELLEGTHVLARPLVVTKPLTLAGAGQRATRVVCSAGGAVVRFVGAAWTVRDLAFAYERPAGRHLPWQHWSDVLVVERGRLVLEDCVCEGARGKRWLPFMPYFEILPLRGGRGLWLGKEGSVRAVRCRFAGNGVYGVEGQDFDLEDCQLSENWDSGLACFKGGGRLVACLVERNEFHGVVLKTSGSCEITGCVIRENDLDGLHFAETATGEARGNTIERNNRDGIRVDGRATPRLVGNAIRSNKVGLAFRDRAGGEAVENVVELSVKEGIQVHDRAAPALTRNTATENGAHGLAYFRQGRGTARENQLRDNGEAGVLRPAFCRADVDGATLGEADHLAALAASVRARLRAGADVQALAADLAALQAFAPHGAQEEVAAWFAALLAQAPDEVDGDAGQHDA